MEEVAGVHGFSGGVEEVLIRPRKKMMLRKLIHKFDTFYIY